MGRGRAYKDFRKRGEGPESIGVLARAENVRKS
jgi:hypothetical protein